MQRALCKSAWLIPDLLPSYKTWTYKMWWCETWSFTPHIAEDERVFSSLHCLKLTGCSWAVSEMLLKEVLKKYLKWSSAAVTASCSERIEFWNRHWILKQKKERQKMGQIPRIRKWKAAQGSFSPLTWASSPLCMLITNMINLVWSPHLVSH